MDWTLSTDGLSKTVRAKLKVGLVAAGYKVSADGSGDSPLCVVRVLGQETAEVSVTVPDPALPAQPIKRTSKLAIRWSEDESISSLAFRAAQLMGTSVYYKEVVDSIRSRKAIAFVGSGLSIEAGYMGWDGLLRNLSNEAGLADIEEQVRQGGEQALELAGRCKGILGDVKYSDLLRDLYGENMIGCTVSQIEVMQMPFEYYFTSNFDPCLEVAAERAKRKLRLHVWPDLPNWGLEKGDIFYLHGKVPREGQDVDIRRIRLTLADYREAYEESDSIARLLSEAMVTGRTLVFLGYGLRDPAIQQALKTAKRYGEKQREVARRYERGAESLRSHYAFVASDELAYQDSLLLFRDCQVQTVEFPVVGQDFSELRNIIMDLFKRTAQAERPSVFGMDGSLVPDTPMQDA